MRAVINNKLISNIKPNNKQFEIRDKKLIGFLIRVNPAGAINYVCEYKRGKRINIGKVSVLTPSQARDKAKTILGDAAKGIEPKEKLKKQERPSFDKFITNEYAHWALTHRKTGEATVKRLTVNFSSIFGKHSLESITPALVEKWRSNRLNQGVKPATINRDIVSLKAALSKAIDWNIIPHHPLSKLKLLKTDSLPNIRYLTKDEEARLKMATDLREERLRNERDNANAWRRERHIAELPNLRHKNYADYMKPMIIISINTGLRRGELLNLRWDDIDFCLQTLTVVGDTAKSGKTRHIPLNTDALSALKHWHEQTGGKDYLFTNHQGKKLTEIKKSWANILSIAEINNFRWHDLRHHFASRLVMAGVDLNTVRELLGHSDIKMTLRYAHLAPEHKAAAVAKLVNF